MSESVRSPSRSQAHGDEAEKRVIGWALRLPQSGTKNVPTRERGYEACRERRCMATGRKNRASDQRGSGITYRLGLRLPQSGTKNVPTRERGYEVCPGRRRMATGWSLARDVVGRCGSHAHCRV